MRKDSHRQFRTPARPSEYATQGDGGGRDFESAGKRTQVGVFRMIPGVPAIGEGTPQVTPQVVALLETARSAVSASDLQQAVGLKDRVHFLKKYLEPLLQAGWIERTIPDKPRSSKQKYRLTAEGEAVRKEREGMNE